MIGEFIMKDNNNKPKTVTFSKDNPIIEISSKQSQIQVKNVIPPVKSKESKKE